MSCVTKLCTCTCIYLYLHRMYAAIRLCDCITGLITDTHAHIFNLVFLICRYGTMVHLWTDSWARLRSPFQTMGTVRDTLSGISGYEFRVNHLYLNSSNCHLTECMYHLASFPGAQTVQNLPRGLGMRLRVVPILYSRPRVTSLVPRPLLGCCRRTVWGQ